MANTILVVEDSELDRKLIAGLLGSDDNYRVELAEDGKVALQWLAQSPPDLVVTDLVMPEMDGLDLVRTMRSSYPQIPVILLTAFGNENTAVEALQAGAVTYVPKAQQAERLMETVERILHLAAADRLRDPLSSRTLECQWRLALENDGKLIRRLTGQVQKMMANVGFGELVERIRVAEALEEALLNAMVHGNLEITEHELAEARLDLSGDRFATLLDLRKRQPECSARKILAVLRISAAEVRFVIRDEGRGFRTDSLDGVAPTAVFGHGDRRGLTLIGYVMDQVRFNEAGNELTMCKRRLTSGAAHLQTASV
jgi:CheY-like chemotaxis protein/anti-sigma regulatory factor (Ser/Thr protein kinase)